MLIKCKTLIYKEEHDYITSHMSTQVSIDYGERRAERNITIAFGIYSLNLQ